MTARIGVFGLGEAGSAISADLAAGGAEVHGFDPAAVPTPPGVIRHDEPREVVRGATAILSITPAIDAQAAIAQAFDAVPRGSLYADLSTAPPTLKQDLADTAALRNLAFADVALMATVPGKGIRTQQLVSGDGAERYAELVEPYGVVVDVIGDEPGAAAQRKLLRSIVMKGLAALVDEAQTAADAAGQGEWLRAHLGQIMDEVDATVLDRLVRGTEKHAVRRHAEMRAAQAMIEQLDVEPMMTRSTVAFLERVASRSDDGGELE